MEVSGTVRKILREALQLGERADRLTDASPLLGSVAEFDSMAVVTLITTLEEQLGITIHDDEIEGATFRDVGALADFVAAKLAP